MTHVWSDDKYLRIFVKYEVWSTGGMMTRGEYDDKWVRSIDKMMTCVWVEYWWKDGMRMEY
jgi:hypothetical protein